MNLQRDLEISIFDLRKTFELKCNFLTENSHGTIVYLLRPVFLPPNFDWAFSTVVILSKSLKHAKLRGHIWDFCALPIFCVAKTRALAGISIDFWVSISLKAHRDACYAGWAGCLFWTMSDVLGNSVVVVVVCMRLRAIPLAMITVRKSTHGFPFLSHDEYGAPLGGSLGRRSSARECNETRGKGVNERLRKLVPYINTA